jgi:hypothetical protein
LAYRSDFQGPSDVIPVSDPGIPSDAHRFAQMQVVAQRADLKPMLYNQRRVEKMILERLRIADPDSFLMPLAEPEEMNAANENAAASFGKPVVAYPHQDHLAHIKTHIDYMNNPLLGSLPLLAPKVLPPMLDHISQHVALWYLGRIYHTVKTHLDGELEEYMEITDDKVKSEIDRTIAAASDTVNKEAQKVFASIPAVVQRAQQLLKQLMPPPQDPNVQVQMARIQSDEKIKGQQLQQKDGTDKATLAQKANESNLRLVNSREQRQSDTGASNLQQASENQRHQASTQSDAAIAALHEMEQNARQEQSDTTKQQVVNSQNATKQAINDADNQTALTISQKEIAAGKHSPLSTGRGLSSQGRGVSE